MTGNALCPPRLARFLILLASLILPHTSQATVISAQFISDGPHFNTFSGAFTSNLAVNTASEAYVYAKTSDFVLLGEVGRGLAMGSPDVNITTGINLLIGGNSIRFLSSGQAWLNSTILTNGLVTLGGATLNFNSSSGTLQYQSPTHNFAFSRFDWVFGLSYLSGQVQQDIGSVPLSDAASGIMASTSQAEHNSAAAITTALHYNGPQVSSAASQSATVQVGTAATFNASLLDALHDVFALPSDMQYLEWDFDNDGVFNPSNLHTFTSSGIQKIAVRATNNFGFTSDIYEFNQTVAPRTPSTGQIDAPATLYLYLLVLGGVLAFGRLRGALLVHRTSVM
ncbi:hypothetical protein P2G88_03010 [Aliiglaciecola sp. CAU 1673]|uniref:hypothetical protein n=1 Tax=Aliiglaciecola sp. CAU 1673 TaxID=3032595 RepID=UPI0023D9D7E9|nr:hypothetical protein [Aliiglaciecola sp. CAU 1673]MDF2177210.1 hypothetical protein [Aliiglaciecola sp. CAU 1673]